jgi:hypothetical protein
VLRNGTFWGGLAAGVFVGMVIIWAGHALLVDALGARGDAAPWLYRIACLALGVGVIGAGVWTRRKPDLENTGTLLVGWGVGLALIAVAATALRF